MSDLLQTTVLLSGGIDSTCLVGHYLAMGRGVEAIFVNWGQPAAERERSAVRSIAEGYEIALSEIDCSGFSIRVPGEVVGRNALLLASALVARPMSAIIGIGIHAGTNYADCSSVFISAMQDVYDLSTGGRCRVDAPFLELTKADVYHLANDLDVPLSRTYSCEMGLAQPCGQCPSCADLVALWS